MYPPQLAHNTLANLDSQGNTLKAAQSTTQSVPTSVTSTLVSNTTNVGGASQTITGAIALQAKNGVGPGTVTAPGLSNTARGYDRIRETMRAKIVSTRVVAGPDGSTEKLELLGGFWDDLFNFLEDVFHAIENAVLDVVNVVVTDTIQITLSLASIGQAIVTLAVQTIQDVESAFITAFRWVEAEVEQVINWLKELFGWTDIVNAGKVIASVVNQFLTASTKYIAPLQTYVDNEFQAWKTNINATLQSLANNTGSMSQYVPQGSSLQVPDSYKAANSSTQSQGNFAHRHVQAYVQSGGSLATQSGSPSALSGLNSVASTTQTNNGSAINSFGTNLQSTVTNSSSFVNSAVKDIIAIIQDVIDAALDAGQWMAEEILKVAETALQALQTALMADLNIPVLNWLFQEVAGEPLSLLNLMSLIFAIPTTIIYKLFNNNEAPFTSTELTAYLEWQCSFPDMNGFSADASTTAVAPPKTSWMLMIMFFTFLVYALMDAISDMLVLSGVGEVLMPYLGIISIVLVGGTLVLGRLGRFLTPTGQPGRPRTFCMLSAGAAAAFYGS